MRLIYCDGQHQRFATIAVEVGYHYGARLPSQAFFPLVFADQDWRKPDRKRYMAALRQHRPAIATMLDLEHEAQIGEVLDWAEEASQWAGRVVIIPKFSGAIARLPRRIGNAEVILGYSVPTRYGATSVPVWEFDGWPIHLLGGSPEMQMALFCLFHRAAPPSWMYGKARRFLQSNWMFAGGAEVVSADGNMATRQATRLVAFWSAQPGEKGHWMRLREIGRGEEWNAPYAAFALSMRHIWAAWREVTKVRGGIEKESGQGRLL